MALQTISMPNVSPLPIHTSPLKVSSNSIISLSVFSTKLTISSARWRSKIPSSVKVILRLPRIKSCFPK